MNNSKKWEFANVLIRIMTHRELKDVTVREICRACNTWPQIFYYHFKDKYDLVEWIYTQDIVAVCESNMDRPWREVLELAFENLMSRKDFYMNAFRDESTNALINFVNAFQVELYGALIKRHEETINDEMTFILNYHAFACAEVTKRWLADVEPVSPAQLTESILNSMPEQLQSLLNRTL
ncbi:MAG: TetR/AcrR family transcriptional regulator C-terminal domain-containing protein [Eubacterium sp.]|nr:TetR/AcrR family transcriptional regulator C-terminal domain-containing protein [Eubacterium sp.]